MFTLAVIGIVVIAVLLLGGWQVMRRK